MDGSSGGPVVDSLRMVEPRGPVSLGTRASGVLLHPTSLPGRHGVGDLGATARSFVDFLDRAGQRWWQMLPVAPPGYGNSPYSAESAFAGSPMLIDLDDLVRRRWIEASALEPAAALPESRVDYARAEAHRRPRLAAAFRVFREAPGADRAPFEAFCESSRGWLDDYALFHALKRAHGNAPWTLWKAGYRTRESSALAHARTELADRILAAKFEQYVFDAQWSRLRRYAHDHGVGLIGDLPIFVAHDSADVWQSPDLFRLDARGEPTVVAGVPPDYFSSTGQRWGNPLYRWRRLRETGYAWWVERLRMMARRFDAIRLDHFIGFQRYWEIPSAEPTAVRGVWRKGPGAELFEVLARELGALPFIAEDLGAVTPQVVLLRDRLRLPGIRVLQFAFGDDPSASTFLPHTYPKRCVVYTGTHDNDTTQGWFHDEGGEQSTRSAAQVERERSAAMQYLKSDGTEIHWDMIRMAWLSVARLAIVPMQDVLGLGAWARMNRPGEPSGNWEWRLSPGALGDELALRMLGLTRVYGR